MSNFGYYLFKFGIIRWLSKKFSTKRQAMEGKISLLANRQQDLIKKDCRGIMDKI
jgi:hypothetical protein